MKIFRTLLWTAIVAITVERCRAEFLLVEIDDAPVKMDEVDGIGKEDETLVVKSKLNQNTLVVESDVISAKDSNKIGEVPDETLVVNSKLNPNTLVVESHVEGAKDSAISREVVDERLVVKSKLSPNTLVVESDVVGATPFANIGEVSDERLVVKSKLSPNTLVVESDVVGATPFANIGEVSHERLVVKSKLSPNTLVVESDVVGATPFANIGEVSDERLVVKSKLNSNTLVVESDIVGPVSREVVDENEIVPTPRECCKNANVPEFCLGNCSPVGAMARQGKRITACSKYDTIIDRCFQAAEPSIQDLGSKNTEKEREIQELARQGICDIKPCCCDDCYPCDYERIVEAKKLAEVKKLNKPKKPLPCPKNVICD